MLLLQDFYYRFKYFFELKQSLHELRAAKVAIKHVSKGLRRVPAKETTISNVSAAHVAGDPLIFRILHEFFYFIFTQLMCRLRHNYKELQKFNVELDKRGLVQLFHTVPTALTSEVTQRTRQILPSYAPCSGVYTATGMPTSLENESLPLTSTRHFSEFPIRQRPLTTLLSAVAETFLATLDGIKERRAEKLSKTFYNRALQRFTENPRLLSSLLLPSTATVAQLKLSAPWSAAAGSPVLYTLRALSSVSTWFAFKTFVLGNKPLRSHHGYNVQPRVTPETVVLDTPQEGYILPQRTLGVVPVQKLLYLPSSPIPDDPLPPVATQHLVLLTPRTTLSDSLTGQRNDLQGFIAPAREAKEHLSAEDLQRLSPQNSYILQSETSSQFQDFSVPTNGDTTHVEQPNHEKRADAVLSEEATRGACTTLGRATVSRLQLVHPRHVAEVRRLLNLVAAVQQQGLSETSSGPTATAATEPAVSNSTSLTANSFCGRVGRPHANEFNFSTLAEVLASLPPEVPSTTTDKPSSPPEVPSTITDEPSSPPPLSTNGLAFIRCFVTARAQVEVPCLPPVQTETSARPVRKRLSASSEADFVAAKSETLFADGATSTSYKRFRSNAWSPNAVLPHEADVANTALTTPFMKLHAASDSLLSNSHFSDTSMSRDHHFKPATCGGSATSAELLLNDGERSLPLLPPPATQRTNTLGSKTRRLTSAPSCQEGLSSTENAQPCQSSIQSIPEARFLTGATLTTAQADTRDLG